MGKYVVVENKEQTQDRGTVSINYKPITKYSVNWMNGDSSIPVVFVPNYFLDSKGIANGIAFLLNQATVILPLEI